MRPLATAHLLRPEVFDRSEVADLPNWLEDLDDRPVVYVTFGTVYNNIEGIFEPILAALADEPLNVIVTTGVGGAYNIANPPANVHVAEYIPVSQLLPRCDAAVTHGGYNTVIAALGSGVPLYAVPLGADQPYNARRCVELGVALSAAPTDSDDPVGAVVEPADLDPATIRADESSSPRAWLSPGSAAHAEGDCVSPWARRGRPTARRNGGSRIDCGELG